MKDNFKEKIASIFNCDKPYIRHWERLCEKYDIPFHDLCNEILINKPDTKLEELVINIIYECLEEAYDRIYIQEIKANPASTKAMDKIAIKMDELIADINENNYLFIDNMKKICILELERKEALKSIVAKNKENQNLEFLFCEFSELVASFKQRLESYDKSSF